MRKQEKVQMWKTDLAVFQQGDVEHGEHQAVPQQGADGAHLRGLEEGAQCKL